MKYLILIVYWMVFWTALFFYGRAIWEEKNILLAILVGAIIAMIVVSYKYVEL